NGCAVGLDGCSEDSDLVGEHLRSGTWPGPTCGPGHSSTSAGGWPPTGSRGARAGQGRLTVRSVPRAEETERGRRVGLDHRVPSLRGDRVRAGRLATDQATPDLGDL